MTIITNYYSYSCYSYYYDNYAIKKMSFLTFFKEK
nr:MAG TPA: hypothetical protein [Caudoviricetes sp.]